MKIYGLKAGSNKDAKTLLYEQHQAAKAKF